MDIVLLIMLLGVAVGYLFRRKDKLIKISEKLVTLFIYLLLFVLGVEVGGDDSVMNNLSSLGLDALLLSLGGIAGSVLVTWGIYISFYKNRGLEASDEG